MSTALEMIKSIQAMWVVYKTAAVNFKFLKMNKLKMWANF